MSQSLNEIQQKLLSGEVTTIQILETCLNNIKKHSNLNAFIHVFEKNSIERAHHIDSKIKNGEKLGKLFGSIVSIKDNICMADQPVSAASKILQGYISPYSSTAVDRLINEDAIIIGSTNCDEFGMGSTSKNSAYGPVRNGKNENLIAGGSSGGAAVSVQMDMCHIALGSDTGGSVRQPASLCDIIGFKPSYGGISRHGLLAYGSSFDVIGILGKDIETIRQFFDVLKGQDDFDSTMINIEDKEKRKKKYAIIKEMFNNDNSYTQNIKEAIINHYGSDMIEEVSFNLMEYLIPCYYILTTAEASSNLSRYDGVRYGFRSEKIDNLEDVYKKSRTEGFGEEVKKRIMLGTFVLSEGYFDAYFTKAQMIRRLIIKQIDEILDNYEAILMPVTPSGAWALDKKIEDPLEIYLSDVYTVLANITGMPAISLPINHNNSLVNYQIMTKKSFDYTLLK